MTFFSLRRTYPFLAVSVLALGLTLPAAAQAAEQIKYLSDPVYEKMAPEDPHPMEDLVLMGEEGDARAQFILGDLYGKGKGGLPRNIKKSREWFEKSARRGYAQSFIRLAALEKRVKKPEDAYKWYTLAIDALPSGERKWAQTARDALVKEHSLTAAQIKSAKAAASAWKKAAADAAEAAKKKAAEEKKQDKKTDANIMTDALLVEPAAGESSEAPAPAAMRADATPAAETLPAADIAAAPDAASTPAAEAAPAAAPATAAETPAP